MNKFQRRLAEDTSIARTTLIDMGDGTHAERFEAHPPLALLTDNNGPDARLRVDVGQTGFFAGREFRTFYEFSIPTGATQVIKVSAPLDVILYAFSVELNLAALKVSLISGGTEGGTFGTALPVLRTNQMSAASGYASQVTLSTGGTHSGGTVFDVSHAISGANPNKATAASASESEPIGFAAGTYYIVLQNTDGATATGVFKTRWEERP